MNSQSTAQLSAPTIRTLKCRHRSAAGPTSSAASVLQLTPTRALNRCGGFPHAGGVQPPEQPYKPRATRGSAAQLPARARPVSNGRLSTRPRPPSTARTRSDTEAAPGPQALPASAVAFFDGPTVAETLPRCASRSGPIIRIFLGARPGRLYCRTSHKGSVFFARDSRGGGRPHRAALKSVNLPHAGLHAPGVRLIKRPARDTKVNPREGVHLLSRTSQAVRDELPLGDRGLAVLPNLVWELFVRGARPSITQGMPLASGTVTRLVAASFDRRSACIVNHGSSGDHPEPFPRVKLADIAGRAGAFDHDSHLCPVGCRISDTRRLSH